MNRRTFKTLSRTERNKTTRRKLNAAEEQARQQREQINNQIQEAQGSY